MEYTAFGFTEPKTNKIHWIIDKASVSWAAVALLGQWAFAAYIITVYVFTYAFGLDISQFSPGQGASKTAGLNYSVLLGHIVPAVYLAIFGMFQLIPNIRKRFTKFHRWNGRVFFTLGLTGALTGLYLTWGAGLRLSNIGAIGISVNGILIVIAIGMAWYHAVNKRFNHHMRWAVHSFILVNAVWTFRLYLMGWYMVNQGSNGNTANLDGPADIFLSFACYLIPMSIVELIFWAKRQKHNLFRANLVALTTVFGVITTLVGVVAALLFMWVPRVVQVFGAV